MGKPNFCKPQTEYICTAESVEKCKFYFPANVGGCKHQRLGRCANDKARKDAHERLVQAEYSNKKLTA